MPQSQFEKEMEKLERAGRISRAQFLQIMAAAGAVVALGTNKAYAAKSNAKGRIVIVGGGAAGISMASRLKRAMKKPDITIIDPSDRHFYQQASPSSRVVSTQPTRCGARRPTACPRM